MPAVHVTVPACSLIGASAGPPPNRPVSFGIWTFGVLEFSVLGGVLDSTLGRSALLHVEVGGYLVKSPAKKPSGNYEEMPLAA